MTAESAKAPVAAGVVRCPYYRAARRYTMEQEYLLIQEFAPSPRRLVAVIEVRRT
jgi:hypothetical protein